MREFNKKSRHFLFGDHLIHSHNPPSWLCMDVVRRKLMLVTIGTSRSNEPKFRPFFILVQFQWNVFNMNQINILWSFSSIEASVYEIFAIKNCCFLALIFVERLEKLSEKTACDVNVGQVKKSGKFKTVFRVDLAWKWFVRP